MHEVSGNIFVHNNIHINQNSYMGNILNQIYPRVPRKIDYFCFQGVQYVDTVPLEFRIFEVFFYEIMNPFVECLYWIITKIETINS
jgi:hypothetical protein